jgi:type IV pilus assembly protein PilW
MMKHHRQYGFSLVELMIAILLAAITAIVVLNVLTSYQSRSNTTSGRNDAQIGAAVGMYALEKDIRMAGAGLNTPSGMLCSVGVNIAWDDAAAYNGAPLVPVRIIDGGAGPDIIEMIRSDSDFGAAPTRLIAAMSDATAQIDVDGKVGLKTGDLVMVGSSDGTKLCTLMQLSADPAVNGSGWRLSHASGGSNEYNPADPSATFATPVAYDVRDNVVNMGSYGIRRYGIVCDGGGAPAATNNCDLAYWNPLDDTAPALGDGKVSSVAPQTIELQAQYGISASASSEVVTSWVDATGAWAWDAITTANQGLIKAVRISIVARGNREGSQVAPPSIVLWQDDPLDASTARVRNFSSAEQRFRYQSLTVVVPVINSIWAGT